jgi:hypothetical protein
MGNAALLSGRYGVALEYFELAVQDNPKLKTILDLNVAIAKKRQSAGALDANVARESVSNDDLETIEKIRSMQKKELMKVISDSGYFDASWYVKEYADVGANKKINPLDHFTRNGLREKRKPQNYSKMLNLKGRLL